MDIGKSIVFGGHEESFQPKTKQSKRKQRFTNHSRRFSYQNGSEADQGDCSLTYARAESSEYWNQASNEYNHTWNH